MNRRDHFLWRFHLIIRDYNDPAQYGLLYWGKHRGQPTLDVWIRRTLYTVRWI